MLKTEIKIEDIKEFTTSEPKEWYWMAYDEQKIQDISPTIISIIWAEPKVWEQINLWSLNWIILEVSPVAIKIDFNEKYTRENAEFHVTVLDIERTKE